MHSDHRAFLEFVASKQSRHPIWRFARGFMYWAQREYQLACKEFESAHVHSLMRFPEALNSLALASYFVDRTRAGRLIGLTLKHWPAYQDAKKNATFLLEGKPDQFRHTFALMPETLAYLSDLNSD